MAKHSLIRSDDQQLKLFGSEDMDPALFSAEEKGPQRIFTGARLFAQDPELYKAIVALSAEGLGAIRIGKILHVSAHTVQAVRQREPENVAIEKNRIAGLARAGARMCVEWIMDKLSDPAQVKKVGIKDLGIVSGILAEKAELLSGAPTARTLNVTATVDYDEYVRGLRNEYERQRMGLGGGNEKTNEQALAGDPAAGVQGPAAGVDQGPGAIVDPGEAGDQASGAGGTVAAGDRRRPIALLAEPAPAGDPAAGEDQGPAAIVDPGANGSIGQTPHRQADMPVNIEPKQGDQNATRKIILIDLG